MGFPMYRRGDTLPVFCAYAIPSVMATRRTWPAMLLDRRDGLYLSGGAD